MLPEFVNTYFARPSGRQPAGGRVLHAVLLRLARAALMPISLWLVPPTGEKVAPATDAPTSTRESLMAEMQTIAEANLLPTYEPHITLMGSVGNLSHDEATARLQALKGAGPVTIAFTKITAGILEETGLAPWYQSGVAVVNMTPQLVSLQRLALGAFQSKAAADTAPVWAPPLRKPHLSLAYGNTPELLSQLQVPSPFVASEVAIYDCTPATLAGVPQWKAIARVPL